MSDVVLPTPKHLDYSLTGEEASRAIERGLAEAEWYQCPVPRPEMRKLLERRDGPAIRDTLIWFSLLGAFAGFTWYFWGTWWAVVSYLCYAVLYASTSDSRWHESGHGTAFRTDWMNNLLYEIASFMVMRESVVWRWSHTRHHSDTIIVGRDPEIAVPRPPDLRALIFGFFNFGVYPKYFARIVMHSVGRMAEEERTFIPESEFPRVFARARIYVGVYLGVIVVAVVTGSWLPVFLVGLVNLFGSWLMPVYGYTQHAGLAENVLDHRLNCRTFYTNAVHRFLYWNMNYHVEHHMFPLVPYHNLPRLHEAIKSDCPEPYPCLWSCWKEIVPTIWKQTKDPAYHITRRLPEPRGRGESTSRCSHAETDAEGWLEVGAAADLAAMDVLRFDYRKKTFAIARDGDGRLFATDGICTHGNTHLADGIVMDGMIECPKHNGRFRLADGSPARAPICRGLATYPIEERSGRLWLNVLRAGGAGARDQRTYTLRVVSNRSVATFIKELVLEPVASGDSIAFTPGDYLQIDIPVYERIAFRDFDIPEPFASVWDRQHVFDLVARNDVPGRRNNYSLASNSATDRHVMFNVRVATPPPGQDCPPGAGSSYVFHLRPGDTVTAIGPFGDFHIKPTQREMIYIGGGAGMAPLRSHISHLFETARTHRKVSYWYGARSGQELYYRDYFDGLAAKHRNFSFHPALSSPLPEDHWEGAVGFIHDVVRECYLKNHPDPRTAEYYLCGPPMMIKACTKMLRELGVADTDVSYDEF